MRGISFEKKNCIDNDIYRILESTGIKTKFCNITFFEGQEDIDFHGIMSGKTFLNTISNKEFYAYFLEAFVFHNSCEANAEKIEDYKGFLNSNCELSLFIYDSKYVEIYCKDESIIKEIESKLDDKYCNIKYITDLNDQRVKFSVF